MRINYEPTRTLTREMTRIDSTLLRFFMCTLNVNMHSFTHLFSFHSRDFPIFLTILHLKFTFFFIRVQYSHLTIAHTRYGCHSFISYSQSPFKQQFFMFPVLIYFHHFFSMFFYPCLLNHVWIYIVYY